MGSCALPRGAVKLTPIWHPSPNFGARRDGALPDIVVLHYTAMDSADRARDWLCNPEAEVSAHYLISETGTVWHMVAEDQRAWHAGAGQWGAVQDVNSRSIGIEIANTGSQPFSEPQMGALEVLLPAIIDRWAIRPERVIGHSDMAPGRKIDPGRRFDWARLARQNMTTFAKPQFDDTAIDIDSLDAPLRALGYTFEAPLETRLDAFRMRHRQHATGAATAADLAMAQDLAARYPVDVSPLIA